MNDRAERCTKAEREFLDAIFTKAELICSDGRRWFSRCLICAYDGLPPRSRRLSDALQTLIQERNDGSIDFAFGLGDYK